MISFKGEEVQIMDLSKRYGIPWSTINNRHIAGYKDDDLIVERLRQTYFKGKKTTLKQIAKDHNLPLDLVKGRHAIGLKDDDLVVRYQRYKGSKNAATKLDAKKVAKIKELLALSDLKQHEIGRLFGIDQSHVSDIKRGKRWTEVKINLESIMTEDEQDA